MNDNMENVNSLISNFDSLHLRCGPTYKAKQLLQAYQYLHEDEMKAIYHLTESHVPGLREKVLYRSSNTKHLENPTLNKRFVEFHCHNTATINDRISNMIKQIGELPKEWHIIQIASQFNILDTVKLDPDKYTTNPLHICVFNCGQIEEKPICITTGLPTTKTDNKRIELLQEIKDVQKEINGYYYELRDIGAEKGKNLNRQYYVDRKIRLGADLRHSVKRIEDFWIKEFKCLFVGKYIDGTVEERVRKEVANIIEENNLSTITDKSKTLLYYLMKGLYLLNLDEVKSLLKIIAPDNVDIRKNINRKLRDCCERYNFKNMKTYPVLLILDENLDFIPWELTSMLEKQLVSRMPSLHFTYALYKEHEHTIKNGYKVFESSLNGKYIINPGLNLPQMEMRLTKFFNYWKCNWKGIAGATPTPKEFEDMLTSTDIFLYCGHGSGVQFLSSQKIETLRINAVAMLFGCKSAGLSMLGPTVEHIGTHYTYLIACSPCVLGMLYNVSDFDTDCITTTLLSEILPTSAPLHWKYVDKVNWHKSDKILSGNKSSSSSEVFKVENDLLKAFTNAKQQATYYITKAACISRGLPIRFSN